VQEQGNINVYINAEGGFQVDISQKYQIPIQMGYRETGYRQQLPHSHTKYEIFYFHQGLVSMIVGDRVYELESGDMILMNGMTLHCPHVDPQFEYERSAVHFDSSYMSEWLGRMNQLNVLGMFQKYGGRRIRLQGESKSEFERLLADLADLYMRSDQVSFHRFHARLVDLLFAVYGYWETNSDHPSSVTSSGKEQKVQQIIDYVEQHYRQDLCLDELQSKLFMNKHHLVKMFKEVTGITIFKYLYSRRINQAQILLLTELHKSVTEIGYEVGFKYPSHFSRAFSERMNCTPHQFRKMSERQAADVE
jgi:AraC-like DNA-binding protein